MTDLTMEMVARKLEELERRLDKLAGPAIAPKRDWRSVVGISEETDFSRQLVAEMTATREAERKAARAARS